MTSPRDRIERTHDVLLDPGVSIAVSEALELELLVTEDLAGLVVDIGGLATYPGQELSYLLDELRRRGVDEVILVTSKAHSRRVRTIWRLLANDSPRAIVRYSTEDPFDPDHWWRHTDSVKAVTMEIFALLNARIGFPLRPLR